MWEPINPEEILKHVLFSTVSKLPLPIDINKIPSYLSSVSQDMRARVSDGIPTHAVLL